MLRNGLGVVALVAIAINGTTTGNIGATEAVSLRASLQQDSADGWRRGAHLRTYDQTLPPIGHVGFCQRYPDDCRGEGSSTAPVPLTQRALRELQEINDRVNAIVEPATDQDIYGEVERWEYPAGKGDCEDYVLLKQRLLVQRGWPRGALLIAVVLDENGEGHAVLAVRTTAGDLILDNKRRDIALWNAVPYTFVKLQSSADPRLWRSASPPDGRDSSRVSGTRSKRMQ